MKLPPRLVSIGLRAYLAVFNRLATSLMRRPDFGFRRYPLSAYNHDAACQTIVDNFVSAILKQAEILVGYADGERVIKVCEALEQEGLARLQFGSQLPGDPTPQEFREDCP
jgi:hypothetical protein